MPALDDIRALRAQRERTQPQSRPAADDTDDDESDDPNVIAGKACSLCDTGTESQNDGATSCSLCTSGKCVPLFS